MIERDPYLATLAVLDALRLEYPLLAAAYEGMKANLRRDMGPERDVHFALTGLTESYVGGLCSHVAFTREFDVSNFMPSDHPSHQPGWNPFDGGADFDDFLLHLLARDEDTGLALIARMAEVGMPVSRCDTLMSRIGAGIHSPSEGGFRYFLESNLPSLHADAVIGELVDLEASLDVPMPAMVP